MSDLEEVLEGLQSHHDDAHVGTAQQLAEGGDTALRQEIAKLVWTASAGGVADGPGCLLQEMR